MSDAPAPTRAEEGREYVLIKHGLYWRPDAQGYTGLLSDAGRYTAEKAAAYAHHDDPSVKAILASEADEFSPACWEETKIAYRDRQLAAAEARAAQAEAEVARLTAALADAEATASLLRKDNERLRWRHPAVLPDWNDLPEGLRIKLARAADGYDPDWGGDLAVNMYATLRQAMMEAPHEDK